MTTKQGALIFISDSGRVSTKGNIVLETRVLVEGSSIWRGRLQTPICTLEDIVAWVNNIEALSCKNIECHTKRNIVDTLYSALEVMPSCQSRVIMSAALQEIQALRELTTKL